MKNKKSFDNSENISVVQAEEVISAKEIVVKKPKAWVMPVVIIGALFYAVWPIDLIPDPIPIIGWLDDLAVVLLAIAKVKSEMDKRKKWNNNG